MAQTLDEFRAALFAFGERVQRVREHVKNEEATKVSLILPFIALLGYDILDPREVAAEHACDFSEKYRNRADYAIMREGVPVIAIECKSVGNGKKDDRGQLKAYFNAAKTVKIGILTDGVRYECFVDSQETHMMDDDPYISFDFSEGTKSQLSDTVLEGVFALTKVLFNPETVSDNARRSIIHRAFYTYLSDQFVDPNVEFTRFLLKEVAIKHVRATAVDGYRAIAKAAFHDVFTSHVLARLDISNSQPRPPRPDPAPEVSSEQNSGPEKNLIVTTEGELRAFEAVRRRLAFLASGRKELFAAIERVSFRDYQGKMAVFYAQERKGRLLDIFENKEGMVRFVLADGGDAAPLVDLSAGDDRLRALFEKRVVEVA